MSENFIGQIQPFGFNYAPRDWAPCNGQIMAISQNTALFSLLGTMYGGNGVNTFGLPNFQGRMIMHAAPAYPQGEVGGTSSVTLLPTQLPAHSHVVNAVSAAATTDTPSANVTLAVPNGETVGTQEGVAVKVYAPLGSPVPLALQSVGPSGGSQPFSVLPPFTVVNVCIALQGIFPPRAN